MKKHYQKLKHSGVAPLGEIPEHWQVKRGRFCMQVNPPLEPTCQLPLDAEVSFIPMDSVGEFGGLNLSETRLVAEIGSGYTPFQNGDVIVAKITPCFENGKGALAAALCSGVAFGTTELHVLRALPSLDRRYLFYLTLSSGYRSTGEAEMYGAGGQKRVPPEFNKDFRTPVPPLGEQFAIANFLDCKTAEIDTLVAKKLALIERLKEKRSALISRTVTRGLPPEAARASGFEPNPKLKPSGIEWLVNVPEHWAVKSLKYYFPPLESGVSVNAVGSSAMDGEIGVLKTSCVYGDIFRPDENKRVLDEEIERVACPVSANGLIISRMNTPELVGSCGFVDKQYPNLYLPDRLWIAKFKSEHSRTARYLWYLITSANIKSRIAAIATGTSGSMKNLAQADFLHLPVAVPNAHERSAIVDFLDRETAKIDSLIATVEQAIERLQEYRTALITAAVTGKIDVRQEEGGQSGPDERCGESGPDGRSAKAGGLT